MGLPNKTVIVTGAAHGIGRAYGEKLASEGAKVALLDIDGTRNEEVAEGIRKAGGNAIAIHTDVRDYSAFAGAVSEVARTFGGVNGLVNNAGMLNVVPITRCKFEDIPDAEWDESFRLNTKSAWYGCKAVLPHLRAAGGGSIVNIASSTIFRAAATRAHYVAAKSALIGFTRTLARELGPDWIRVNVVCPGSTLSEEDPSAETVAMREAVAKIRCLQRVERPNDLVGTIAFLMSDDSAFITGQTLLVDGGSAFN
ncbi:MAG TPA: SDR family NAD(P)-dependent oxidoreductase [Candidatus Limnocylindria bacterium]|jgi:3-oxoacyl-[acyl-carrier protein] reductase|nr:SDR family NAD(P)-dependent oxidoreductase [Candidatus Limnocylindria bacterium]